MRRLFLHIGYPKTGTTSLQRFLAANEVALAARGVLYPQTGRWRDAQYGMNFALGLGAYDRPAELPAATPAEIAAGLAAEVEASGCERIVVSSEYFAIASVPDRAKVQALFAGYDVKIVCYLRRHDDALESAYAQAVKSVTDPPWQTNAESYVLHELGLGTVSYDYLAMLRQWGMRFGQGSVIVRPYEWAQNQPDIQADFLRVIGVEDDPGFVRPPAANPSIGPRTAAAIHMVRRTGLPDEAKRHMVGRLIMADARAPSRAHFLPAVQRMSLVRRHLHMYRVIAKEFLDQEAPLFTAPLPDDTDECQLESGFTHDALVETMLRALVPVPDGA